MMEVVLALTNFLSWMKALMLPQAELALKMAIHPSVGGWMDWMDVRLTDYAAWRGGGDVD
jgi:hypothetical protein